MAKKGVLTGSGRNNLVSALTTGSSYTITAIGVGDSGTYPNVSQDSLQGAHQYYTTANISKNGSEGWMMLSAVIDGSSYPHAIAEVGLFDNTVNKEMFYRFAIDPVYLDENSSVALKIIIQFQ